MSRSTPASSAVLRPYRTGQARHLFGERPPRTGWIVAEQPPDLQPDHHPPPADRRIGQPPLIPAVHPPRAGPAPAARRLLRLRMSPDPQACRTGLDVIDHDGRQVRQQHPQVHQRAHAAPQAQACAMTRADTATAAAAAVWQMAR
jgi:hypothetical protein